LTKPGNKQSPAEHTLNGDCVGFTQRTQNGMKSLHYLKETVLGMTCDLFGYSTHMYFRDYVCSLCVGKDWGERSTCALLRICPDPRFEVLMLVTENYCLLGYDTI
jgi:hypothetical protein